MEKTPKYDLSQWTKTDRILMEDFNADNARLEAALSALAAAQTAETARVNTELAAKATTTALNSAKSALQTEDARLNSVKLQFYTLVNKTITGNGSTTQTVSLPSGTNFGNFVLLYFHFTMKSGNASPYLCTLPGGTGFVQASAGHEARVACFPMLDGSDYLMGLNLENGAVCKSSQRLSEITGLQLKASDSRTLDGKYELKIYGVR